MSMEENISHLGLLEVIAILTSRGGSGRLQIARGATRGAFFFNKGKLVDASMDTLTGFPAVIFAVSIREPRLSFNPSIQPPRASFNALNEQIILRERFGIQAVGAETAGDQVFVAEGAEGAFAHTLSTPVLSQPLAAPSENKSSYFRKRLASISQSVRILVKPSLNHSIRENVADGAEAREQTQEDVRIGAEQGRVEAEALTTGNAEVEA
ncbi:MAG: DUF4388 domain-containing protein, partial [Pyrinomonadaceae bacterium]|nr:DUF4388 domain-containing protein [Pyrinomonadaceae bacterium]